MAKFRDAIEADLPAMLGIYNHYVLTSAATPICDPLTDEGQHCWFATQNAERLPILVADQDGSVAGYCYVSRLAPGKSFALALEEHIYLDPDYIGRGLGTSLLQTMTERAARLSIRTLIARVDANNQASLRVHQKCGFATVGTLRDIAYKNGAFLSLTIMQRLFEGGFNFDRPGAWPGAA